MAYTKEELKNRVEVAAMAGGRNVQFGSELRRDILEYSREQQISGRSQHAIAAELGMKGWTLNRWHQNERRAKATIDAGFVEVVAKKLGRPPKESAPPPAMAFEVTCPSGFEVRVPASFDAGAFKRLLNVIEGG
jgi:hypothetical protein